MLSINLRGPALRRTLAIAGAIAWITQGYDQALMNGLLTLPTFVKSFPAIDTSTPALDAKNATLQGTTVALYEVGAAVGALSCYFLGERFGRKWLTFAGAATVLIGVILQSTSFQLAQLIVARIITGMGVGSFTATIPTWVGESTEAHQRGALILLEGSAALFGIMFVGWVELGFFFVKQSEVSWRFPIALQAIFPIIVMAVIPFLSESPRWLISKDRMEEARAVLCRLEDEPDDSQLVAARMHVIQNAVSLDAQAHSKNPFAKTSNRHLHRTLLAVGVNILAQLSGINVITFYSTSIFEQSLGYSALTARIISNCLQTWQFLCATGAIFLVDRFGRRKLLLFGAATMCLANLGLTALQSQGKSPAIGGVSIFFYFVVLLAFPIGMFMIPFLYASEIAPLRIRSQVTAMSGGANWLFNFLVAEITPKAFASIQWRYYIVYICTNLTAVIVFYLFLPETKNRTLEDVDAFFLDTTSPFQPVANARKMPPGFAETFDISDKAQNREDVEKREFVIEHRE